MTSSAFRFDPDFLWGAATSSYQIEGGAAEDGRSPSIWDTFCRVPGAVAGGDHGDVACDSYHRWAEDVALLKGLGVRSYRFSISWSRVLPQGRGIPNRAGLDYYHRLVDALLAEGIQPFCTLYHWDLPQVLQDAGGWENRATIDAFAEYAELIFREFAGQIRLWLTFNEPFCSAFVGHLWGAHAPGVKDFDRALAVAHHHLVAHGRAVDRFRALQAQGADLGQIGIAPNITWSEPWSLSEDDRQASLRNVQWSWDWFVDPILFGRYPEPLASWFAAQGHRPPILPGDLEQIQRPLDLLGGNYYSSSVVRAASGEAGGLLGLETLGLGYETSDIGWALFPAGLTDSLVRIADKYGNLPFYITENGICINDPDDQRRIVYFDQHLRALARARARGVNLRGYMAWSLLDNFEWAEGYSKRFGLVHVDFATGQRTPKPSYHWYRDWIAGQPGLARR